MGSDFWKLRWSRTGRASDKWWQVWRVWRSSVGRCRCNKNCVQKHLLYFPKLPFTLFSKCPSRILKRRQKLYVDSKIQLSEDAFTYISFPSLKEGALWDSSFILYLITWYPSWEPNPLKVFVSPNTCLIPSSHRGTWSNLFMFTEQRKGNKALCQATAFILIRPRNKCNQIYFGLFWIENFESSTNICKRKKKERRKSQNIHALGLRDGIMWEVPLLLTVTQTLYLL